MLKSLNISGYKMSAIQPIADIDAGVFIFLHITTTLTCCFEAQRKSGLVQCLVMPVITLSPYNIQDRAFYYIQGKYHERTPLLNDL